MVTKNSHLSRADQSIPRILNRQIILELLRTHDCLTQRQLSTLTGLSAPTILSVLDELIQEQLVMQGEPNGSNGKSKGRPPRCFRFFPERSAVIGIDVRAPGLTVMLTNLSGHSIVRLERPWLRSAHPEDYIGQLVAMIGEVKQMALAGGHGWAANVEAVGIALRGLVAHESGTPLGYAPLRILNGIPIGQAVADRTGLTVTVDNNVFAMAWGEYWFGAGRGIRNLVCLNIGRGVGASAIVNGQLLYGPDGSMQIGHTTVDTDGVQCWCGNFGCLEMYASDTSVIKQASKLIKLGHATMLTEMAGDLENLTIVHICTAARLGDALALQIIQNAALYIGIGIANLVNLLNPEAIIITGWVLDVEDILLPKIHEIAAKRALLPMSKRIKLIPAFFRQDTALQGAVALALSAAGIVPTSTNLLHSEIAPPPTWPVCITPQMPTP